MAKDTGAEGQEPSDETTNSLDDAVTPPEPVIPDGPRRNLTRESIYGTLVNQLHNNGKFDSLLASLVATDEKAAEEEAAKTGKPRTEAKKLAKKAELEAQARKGIEELARKRSLEMCPD